MSLFAQSYVAIKIIAIIEIVKNKKTKKTLLNL